MCEWCISRSTIGMATLSSMKNSPQQVKSLFMVMMILRYSYRLLISSHSPEYAAEPNLRFQPEFRLTGENETISIGTSSFSYAVQKPYVGWDRFSNEIFDLLDAVEAIGEVLTVERVAFRYLNLLENADGIESDFKQTNFDATLGSFDLTQYQTAVKLEIDQDEYIHVIQVRNHASVTHTTNQEQKLASYLTLTPQYRQIWLTFGSRRLRSAERDIF